MGWTSEQKPTNIKQWFIREWEMPFGDGHTRKVLEVKIVKLTTLYAAIEKINNETGEREVFAVVTLLRYGRGFWNFSHKDMSEHMHPYFYQCPRSILEKLTPTDSEDANAWRAKCWEWINRTPEDKAFGVYLDGKLVKTYDTTGACVRYLKKQGRLFTGVIASMKTNVAWTYDYNGWIQQACSDLIPSRGING